MTTTLRRGRIGIAALAFASLAGCAQSGGLGGILGSVLGGGNGNQVTGTVQRVDPRYQQISIAQSNGQQLSVAYDNNTQVIFQNQQYSVANLEYGDRVTARIQQAQNGNYYTDYVQVDRPVNGSNTGNNGSGQVQSLQGTVRSVDVQNGAFQVEANNYGMLTVSLPYNANRTDVQRLRGLRVGDVVRFTGVYLSNARMELRQFY